MATMERMLDVQEDNYNNIREKCVNIKKLKKDKRTWETLSKSYNAIQPYWNSFVDNHAKLVRYENLPKQYIEKYRNIRNKLKNVGEFIQKIFPNFQVLDIGESASDNEGGGDDDSDSEDESQDIASGGHLNPDGSTGSETKIRVTSSVPSPTNVNASTSQSTYTLARESVDHRGNRSSTDGNLIDVTPPIPSATVQPPISGDSNHPAATLQTPLSQGQMMQTSAAYNNFGQSSPFGYYGQAQGYVPAGAFQQGHPGIATPGYVPVSQQQPIQPGIPPHGYIPVNHQQGTIPQGYVPVTGFQPGYQQILPQPAQQGGFAQYNPYAPVHGLDSGIRGMRVADMKLKPFEGDYKEYRNFRNSFRRMSNEYQTHEKFEYLRTKLAGKAFRIIEHLENIDANYDKAWEILDKKFYNPRFQLESNLKKLFFELPSARARDIRSIENLHQAAVGIHSNLEALDVHWKDLFTFHVIQQLDPKLRTDFYGTLDGGKVATDQKLFDYLDNVQQTFSANLDDHDREDRQRQNRDRDWHRSKGKANSKPKVLTHGTTEAASLNDKKQLKCFICSGNHAVVECNQLLTSKNRDQLLREHKICIYCMKHKYDYRNPCRSKDSIVCSICNKNHIMELHTPEPTTAHCAQIQRSKQPTDSSLGASVILPTVIATVLSENHTTYQVRCLVDQCSQSNYITESLAQAMKLVRSAANVVVVGVGGTRTIVKHQVNLRIQTNDTALPMLNIIALVVPKITENLPTAICTLDCAKLEVKLADPLFHKAASVKILLGSDVYAQILKPGIKKVKGYLLQDTSFGWMVSAGRGGQSPVIATHISMLEAEHQIWRDLESKILAFWDMPLPKADSSPEDAEYCEKQFKAKHYRLADGRYVVPIPWKPDAPSLGESYTRALKFFYGQEYRWIKNKEHKQKSDDFMKEYINLGHMSLIPPGETRKNDGKVFYLPYISILRKDALTTKLRNVFNGSAASDNSVTLNQCILPGPSLQTRITDIITNIRQYRYIYSSDVCKMFRQINLLPEDADRLRILWRQDRYHPVKEYKLNTITYGLDCAPFQAIRTLHQIAEDNAPDEETKRIIKTCFYMDDLAAGANTIDECQRQINKIIQTMEAGKMPLTKWNANHPGILSQLNDEVKVEAYIDPAKGNTATKMLGLIYDKDQDAFSIKVKEPLDLVYTKRGLLSMCASIYDPLGWLLPVVMKLRILIQKLWREKYDWDDEISPDNVQLFKKCLKNIQVLSSAQIPRWTGDCEHDETSLIGFCDASGDGYAAVLYCRTKHEDGIRITLITASAHVVPLKSKIGVKKADNTTPINPDGEEPGSNGSKPKINEELTIPKLELEAIHLLVTMYNANKDNFKTGLPFRIYTDSEIALAWVRNQKTVENRYVQRKVNAIRKVVNPGQIHYVRSAENPSDLPSRGLNAEQLIDNELWFQGPKWLKDQVLPTTPFKDPAILLTNVCQEEPEGEFIEKFSNWERLQRGVAIALRCANKLSGPLHSHEIQTAKKRIIRIQQRRTYRKEVQLIQQGKPLPRKGTLATLNAFLDKDNLLRVGGRLSRSELSYNQKHPIILPKCHLSDLIIASTHTKYGHAGNRQVEALLQENYRIAAAKQGIKRCIRKCIICTRWKGLVHQPMMSDLPEERITFQPNFNAISVDLAGPFQVKASRLRSDRPIKVWVAVFVCQLSKAVHLEAVCELSTEEFLAAFARFTSRRGQPTHILSDNQTNFVLADKLIKTAWQEIKDASRAQLALREIKWVFSPPRSPSFNGLAEAMVKTFKYFANRLANSEALRYDEFVTLLCKIEGFINSRPLAANPDDPNGLTVLTPFLLCTQRQMEPFILDEFQPKGNPLTKRYHTMMKIQQELWQRFEKEYMQQLQTRYKWKAPTRVAKVGDIVLVKDLGLKPPQWPLGRIEEVLPDRKGNVRRVNVRMKDKVLPRAVDKLIPVIDEDLQENEACASTAQPREEKTPPPPNNDPSTNAQSITTGPSINNDKDSTEAPSHSETPPKPRRSPRLTTLLTNTVLCWLTFAFTNPPIKPASAMGSNSLDTGFSSLKGIQSTVIGLRQVHARDMDLTINTGINVTQDLYFINNETKALETYCLTTAINGPGNITAHCRRLYEGLADEAGTVKEQIERQYSRSQRKRNIGSVALGVLKFVGPKLVKQAPNIVLAGSVAYGIVDSYHTRAKIDDLKRRQSKLTELTMRLGNIDHDQVENDISRLYSNQQYIALVTEVTGYVTELRAILRATLIKHEQLKTIVPSETLLENLRQQVPAELQLADFEPASALFNFHPRTLFIKDNIAMIRFLLPLTLKAKQQEYELTNQGNHQTSRVIINTETLSYALSELQTYCKRNLTIVRESQAISRCLKSALLNRTEGCTDLELERLKLTLDHHVKRAEVNMGVTMSTTFDHKIHHLRFTQAPLKSRYINDSVSSERAQIISQLADLAQGTRSNKEEELATWAKVLIAITAILASLGVMALTIWKIWAHQQSKKRKRESKINDIEMQPIPPRKTKTWAQKWTIQTALSSETPEEQPAELASA